MRIFMVRHGETLLNKKGCYYGLTDVSLSDYGIRQAEELGLLLADQTFDRVISSPLVRARQTARRILGDSSLPVETDMRLSEQNFGIFEGLTYHEIESAYPGELAMWNESFESYRIPDGESFADVRSRADSFADDLWKMTASTGTLLLAAHKGTLGHLLASLLHLPLKGYWNFAVEQGCFSCLDLEDGYVILRCLNSREI